MFNYRRIYINSAKFSKIGKGMRLPIMVDTRFLYLFSITLIITAFISYVLGWFRKNQLYQGKRVNSNSKQYMIRK